MRTLRRATAVFPLACVAMSVHCGAGAPEEAASSSDEAITDLQARVTNAFNAHYGQFKQLYGQCVSQHKCTPTPFPNETVCQAVKEVSPNLWGNPIVFFGGQVNVGAVEQL